MTKTEIFFTFKEHKLTFDEFLNLTEKELDQVLHDIFQSVTVFDLISQSFSWLSVNGRECAPSKNHDAALLFK